MNDMMKQSIFWGTATVVLTLWAYKSSDERISAFALSLAMATANMTGQCLDAAIHDFWQIQGPDQYPQLS
jgi:hypothetical protein